jgi:hypothetical protein
VHSVVSAALLSMGSFSKGRSQEANAVDEFIDTASSSIAADSSGPLLIDMGRYAFSAAGDEPQASELRIMLVRPGAGPPGVATTGCRSVSD